MVRKVIIDTDTASDDVVAIIMALREPSIRVEAITAVAGNVKVDLASKNARISVEKANTYTPPVYKGVGKPLMRELFTSEFVHGKDGMGDMNLPEPKVTEEQEHAVDAIIHLIMSNPGEIEVVTLGPLMNLALAYLKEPRIAEKVKKVVIMGGAGLGPGNITPVAEFNMYVDAEAASIVLQSGMPITMVGWDVCLGKTFLSEEDIKYLQQQSSEIAEFCVRCNQSVEKFDEKRFGKKGFDLPDPTAMAVAISDEIILKKYEAYVYVETNSEQTYGQVIIDQHHLLEKNANVTICEEVDAKKFKELLFKNII